MTNQKKSNTADVKHAEDRTMVSAKKDEIITDAFDINQNDRRATKRPQ